jgi:hypothetical protein
MNSYSIDRTYDNGNIIYENFTTTHAPTILLFFSNIYVIIGILFMIFLMIPNKTTKEEF